MTPDEIKIIKKNIEKNGFILIGKIPEEDQSDTINEFRDYQKVTLSEGFFLIFHSKYPNNLKSQASEKIKKNFSTFILYYEYKQGKDLKNHLWDLTPDSIISFEESVKKGQVFLVTTPENETS